MKMKPKTVEGYLEGFPEDQKTKLIELRKVIKSALPESQETLKWGNPAIVDKDGMILVIFAGYKQHMNVVFTPSTKQAFEDKLTKYKTGKGSVQLAYDKQLPAELIKKMVLYRANEYREQRVKWM